MDYNINGKITLHIDLDINADSEEDALIKAKDILKDGEYFDLLSKRYKERIGL